MSHTPHHKGQNGNLGEVKFKMNEYGTVEAEFEHEMFMKFEDDAHDKDQIAVDG